MRRCLDIAQSKAQQQHHPRGALGTQCSLIHEYSRNLGSALSRYRPAPMRYWNFTQVPAAMSRAARRWGSFPCRDQVSLWLFEQPVFFFFPFFEEISVNVGQGPGKVALLTLSASQILVGICPGHTFAFGQNAAAQAEQRGESEPLQPTGRHRALEAPGEALSAGASRYSASPKLWKRRQFLYFSRNRNSFSWPGKLWQLLLLLAVICSSGLTQRRDTRSWTLWRHREAGQMRQRRLRYTSLTAAFLNTPALLVLSAVTQDTCSYFDGLFFFPPRLLWTSTPRVRRQYCS